MSGKQDKIKSITYSELNNITESGFYRTTGTASILIHVDWDVNFMGQIYFRTAGDVLFRVKTGGTWGGWKKFTYTDA